MNALKWEDPESVPRPAAKQDWRGISEALKDRPGEWALIVEDVSSATAGNLRSGAIRAFRPVEDFEVKARGIKNNRIEKVFARYIGEATE